MSGRALVESSRVAVLAKRLASGSVCWAAAAGVLTAARRIESSAIRRESRGHRTVADGDDAVRIVLRGSWLFGFVDELLSQLERYGRHSSIAKWVGRGAENVASLESGRRIRLIGWAVAMAVVARAAMARLSHEVVGWPTWSVWLAVASVAIILIFASRAVAAAWEDRMRRHAASTR